MKTSVRGIHHVTAIAGDAQENLNFYAGVMGMRLVKKSVNQDAPDTYHLFYADGVGNPGTDLTFFPWPAMPPAKLGIGLTVEVPFAVPIGALAYWQERFAKNKIAFGNIETRFGEKVLPFKDPHGLQLALAETGDEREFVAWNESAVPPEYQLRGMHAVRLWERDLKPTERLLTQVMRFAQIGAEDGWHRYGVEGGTSGKIIELKELPHERRGQWGTGGVHHVAWRTKDSAESILTLANEFDQKDFAFFAPRAGGAGGTWYPNRFLAPTASNEPWLSPARRFFSAAVMSIFTFPKSACNMRLIRLKLWAAT